MKRKARVTVRVLRQMKQAGEKITMLTAYDYFTARVLDQCGVDMLLVGDTVGMAFAGHDTTLSVRIDHIVYHGEIVSRAAERSMIVGDMPFLSYQVNIDHAVENAGRLMQDAKVQAVKLEGGRAMVPVIKRILRAGIPVMGAGSTGQRNTRVKPFSWSVRTPRGTSGLTITRSPQPHPAGEVTESLTIPTIGIWRRTSLRWSGHRHTF